MTSSSVPFPRESVESLATRQSHISQNSATALDVCNFVYGVETELAPHAIYQFYEASAVYENPFMTATSRSVITDIYRLSRQLSAVDVPKPLAMFYTLFRVRKRTFNPRDMDPRDDPLFQAMHVWTEMGDVSESESFDGHRRSIVEHTLNILLLPGVHTDHGATQAHASSSEVSLLSTASRHHPTAPGLPLPLTDISLPSPLHFQLHVITRLSFNEAGLITHHRDFYDVKDVLAMLPGMGLVQWISGRLVARSLSWVASWVLPASKDSMDNSDLESARN